MTMLIDSSTRRLKLFMLEVVMEETGVDKVAPLPSFFGAAYVVHILQVQEA